MQLLTIFNLSIRTYTYYQIYTLIKGLDIASQNIKLPTSTHVLLVSGLVLQIIAPLKITNGKKIAFSAIWLTTPYVLQLLKKRSSKDKIQPIIDQFPRICFGITLLFFPFERVDTTQLFSGPIEALLVKLNLMNPNNQLVFIIMYGVLNSYLNKPIYTYTIRTVATITNACLFPIFSRLYPQKPNPSSFPLRTQPLSKKELEFLEKKPTVDSFFKEGSFHFTEKTFSNLQTIPEINQPDYSALITLFETMESKNDCDIHKKNLQNVINTANGKFKLTQLTTSQHELMKKTFAHLLKHMHQLKKDKKEEELIILLVGFSEAGAMCSYQHYDFCTTQYNQIFKGQGTTIPLVIENLFQGLKEQVLSDLDNQIFQSLLSPLVSEDGAVHRKEFIRYFYRKFGFLAPIPSSNFKISKEIKPFYRKQFIPYLINSLYNIPLLIQGEKIIPGLQQDVRREIDCEKLGDFLKEIGYSPEDFFQTVRTDQFLDNADSTTKTIEEIEKMNLSKKEKLKWFSPVVIDIEDYVALENIPQNCMMQQFKPAYIWALLIHLGLIEFTQDAKNTIAQMA
jgi:hypothetical protein